MSGEMTITGIAPWFGSNRRRADLPGLQLKGYTHITIPFAGSMCEVPHMPPKAQLYVCDLHDDLINLAEIIADDERRKLLATALAPRLFHPKTLEDAQARLAHWRQRSGGGLFGGPSLDASQYDETARAADFFTVSWMSRNGTAGAESENRSGLALRSCGYGGDASTRFRSAVGSLEAWGEALRRCMFARESCWDTIPRVFDRARALAKQGKEPKLGIYADPPWPDDGERYVHPFTEADQRRLARLLNDAPAGVRIVVRYGDHPLIRELYPILHWTWIEVDGRTQTNAKKSEVLLVNGPAHTEAKP